MIGCPGLHEGSAWQRVPPRSTGHLGEQLECPFGGAGVAVEVWSVPAAAVACILVNEPDGLTLGKVRLADGSVVLGVLGEPAACEGQKEITAFGGWRAYMTARTNGPL